MELSASPASPGLLDFNDLQVGLYPDQRIADLSIPSNDILTVHKQYMS